MESQLPGWVVLYVVVLAVVSGAGVSDDLRDRRPLWYVAAGTLSGFASVLLVVAYWLPGPAASLGSLLAALLIFAIAFDLGSALVDLRSMKESGEFSGRVPQIATALVLLLFAPAYALGLLVVLRPALGA